MQDLAAMFNESLFGGNNTNNNDPEADRLYGELKKILNHIGMADHHVLEKNF